MYVTWALPVCADMLFVMFQPHVMRNSMLSVLGVLVMNLLTAEKLDENQKNLRETFLATILEHLHDTNGFVRAKVSRDIRQVNYATYIHYTFHITACYPTPGNILFKSAKK